MSEKLSKLTLTVPETAKILGVSKTTAYQLVRSEGFPALSVGNRVLVYREGLEEWLREQAKKGVQT